MEILRRPCMQCGRIHSRVGGAPLFFSRISRGPAKHQGLSRVATSSSGTYHITMVLAESIGRPVESHSRSVFENVGARFSLRA